MTFNLSNHGKPICIRFSYGNNNQINPNDQSSSTKLFARTSPNFPSQQIKQINQPDDTMKKLKNIENARNNELTNSVQRKKYKKILQQNKENQLSNPKKSLCQSVILASNFENKSSQQQIRLEIKRPLKQFNRVQTEEDKYLSPSSIFLNSNSNLQQTNRRINFTKQKSNINYVFSKIRNKLKKQSLNASCVTIQDFQIGQMLGKGSFGYVYIVRHKASGYFFALKKLKKSSIKDIDQFINSIRGHFLLNHPNLVKLYTVFYDKEYIYLLLELCIDGNLAKFKKHIKSECQKGKIVLGIARGVQYMHNIYLRHGDIKLQNILISYGLPKIADFDCIFNGKYKQFLEPRRKSKLWGSPAYFSPQMISASTFALDDDIWSLGIIIYELYCGQHPFDIKISEDLEKIANQEINQFRIKNNQNLKCLICRILNKNRQQRPSIQQIIQQYSSMKIT